MLLALLRSGGIVNRRIKQVDNRKIKLISPAQFQLRQTKIFDYIERHENVGEKVCILGSF